MNTQDKEDKHLLEENVTLKQRIKELEQSKTELQRKNDALLESEKKYRFIADNTAEIIRIMDADMRCIYVSPSVFRIRGVTVEEARTETFAQFVTPASLQIIESIFAEEKALTATGAAEASRVRTFEAEVCKKNGSLFWMEVSFSVFRNENGEFGGVISVARDISKRKAAEAALRKSEETFRALVENSRDAILRFDRNHRYIYANPVVREQTGISPEEFIGKTFDDFGFPEALRARWHESVERIFLSGKVERDEFQLPNGQWIDMIQIPERDASGQVEALIAMGRDITENKKNVILFQSLFHLSPLAICVVDGNRVMTQVNDYALTTFGYSREEMIGQNTRFLYSSDEDYEAAGKALYSVNDTAQPVRMRRKDGEGIWVLLNRSYLNGRDASGGSIVVVQDITARKALEDQLRQAQKMEAIGQLAGGVAHDFNNILQAILGYTHMILLSLGPDDKNRRKLEQVEKAGEKAAALTRQLLAFSRRQVLQLGPIDLNRTIEDLLKMLHRLIGEHIELNLVTDSALWTVNADRGQMEQVLMNLCVNARDAMPEGGRLSIETSNVRLDDDYCSRHDWAKPGRYVKLSITDSGSGIAPETKGKIFDPFFTTKEQGRGTGLGLATVYGIVRQHEGMIHVYSETGKGSRFSVYIPAGNQDAEEISREEGDSALGGHETILLAEDDETLRFLTTEVLRSAGYHVLVAVDGEDALGMFQKHAKEIDLLLLDVVMPKKGGRCVYEKIRTIRPDICCLFMSGYSKNAIHTNFILDHGLNLIEKPFKVNNLLIKVRQELDRSQPPAFGPDLDRK